MVLIYIIQPLKLNGMIVGEKSRAIFRFYDEGEVPDDLPDRMVRWANHFGCGFEANAEGSMRRVWPKVEVDTPNDEV